jgi:hypothetical protein
MAALYRGGKNVIALCVRKSDGNFRDFGASGKYPLRGDLDLLLKLLNHEGGIDSVEIKEATPTQDLKKDIVYDESCLKRLMPMWDFFTSRGISEDTMRLFRAGTASSGKLNRRVCFPIFDKDKIIGFAGRWHQKVPPENTPKWKIIGRKKAFIFPSHLNSVHPDEGIILVESIGCVLRLYEAGITNAFCLFGIELSGALLKKILSENPKRIIISTNNEVDNDSIGNIAAQDAKDKLLKYYDESKVFIELPPKKDFFEMTVEEVKTWYNAVRSKHETF